MCACVRTRMPACTWWTMCHIEPETCGHNNPPPCRFLCTHALSRSRLPPAHESCTATCGATGGARQVRPPRTYAGCNVVNSNSSSNINRMLLQQQNAAAAAHDKPWTPRGQPRVGPPRQLTWWRRCRFCRPPRALGECRECSGRGPTASDTCEATAVADDAGGVAQPTAPQPRRDPPVAEQAPSPALLPDSGTGQTRRRRSSALHRQAGPQTSPTNQRISLPAPGTPRSATTLRSPRRPAPRPERTPSTLRGAAAGGGRRRQAAAAVRLRERPPGPGAGRPTRGAVGAGKKWRGASPAEGSQRMRTMGARQRLGRTCWPSRWPRHRLRPSSAAPAGVPAHAQPGQAGGRQAARGAAATAELLQRRRASVVVGQTLGLDIACRDSPRTRSRPGRAAAAVRGFSCPKAAGGSQRGYIDVE